jgi:hypothetical protein
MKKSILIDLYTKLKYYCNTGIRIRDKILPYLHAWTFKNQIFKLHLESERHSYSTDSRSMRDRIKGDIEIYRQAKR